jgi:7-carboxy-7-deazaguanine synthase
MGLPHDKIPVLEQFVSIQGEGLNVGVPYVFIRVGGCPLRCRFCDSEYTWKFKKEDLCLIYELVNWVVREARRHGISWVSITGGEPLLYPDQLYTMLKMWDECGLKTHIETSGRFHDKRVHKCTLWSMDIKTPCTGEVQEDDLKFLVHMRRKDQVKCLIADREDIEYARHVHRELSGRCILVLQPFNTDLTPDGSLENMRYQLLIKYGWIVEEILSAFSSPWPNTIITPQIHVLTWGNKTSV